MIPSLARLTSKSTTPRMSMSRLVRFIPRSSSPTTTTTGAAAAAARPLIGEPTDRDLDVGLATFQGKDVEVDVYSGMSVLSPGTKTGERRVVDRLLSPVSREEVGTIRCIGLNYHTHAAEMNMPTPTLPTVFLKPELSLGDPFPAPTIIPRPFVQDDAADYEAELALVIGKDCKNVSEADAMDHLLGYTAANDVSSRLAQFAQSQWCYSKGFDGSCPIGPTLVPKDQVPDIGSIKIKSSLNGKVVQDGGIDVPQIISFLSQGTTLKAGTVILTGTPAGVGWSSKPRRTLKDGDDFRVYLSHGVGTLINEIKEER